MTLCFECIIMTENVDIFKNKLRLFFKLAWRQRVKVIHSLLFHIVIVEI